jgi:hypothetical protein
MKKITTVLGKSHNEFDHQIKDILNDMSDTLYLILEQKMINKNAICGICNLKADVITITINDGLHKSFCNKCLTK